MKVRSNKNFFSLVKNFDEFLSVCEILFLAPKLIRDVRKGSFFEGENFGKSARSDRCT